MRSVSGGRWRVLALVMVLVAAALAGPALGRGQAASGAMQAVRAVVPLGPTAVATDPDNLPDGLLVDATGGRVYAVSTNDDKGRLTVLDAATARVLRRLPLPPNVAPPLLDARRNRLLLVAAAPDDTYGPGGPGGVLLLDARRLAVVARLAAGYDPVALAYDAGRGHLFVGAGGLGHPSRITTIDTASGRVLRTVALGRTFERGVTGAAVDPRSGRLLAVVAYGPEDAFTATARAVVLGADGTLLHTVPLGSMDTGELTWIPPDPSALSGQVVVDAQTGHAFISLDAQVLMLDPTSGRVLARVALPPAAGSGARQMAVDAQTGRVFVAASGGVAVLDARTGRLRRGVPVAQPTLTPAPVLSRVYVESRGVRAVLLTLDAASGAVDRTVDLGAHAAALAAVDARTGRLFLTNTHFNQDGDAVGPGAIDVRDARTGALRAHVAVGQDPAQVAVDGRTGGAFALDQTADTLIALAPGVGTGPPLPPTPVPPTPTSAPARLLPLPGIAALAADPRPHRAFVALGNEVRVLDTRSGQTLRAVPLGTFSTVLAVDARHGRVIASRGRAAVSVLDARTGALRRTVSLPYRVAAIALDARTGMAYLAGAGPAPTGYGPGPGYVSALDPATGRLRYTVRVERELYALALDPASGHLFATSAAASNVVMLDARTGATLRTVAAGTYLGEPLAAVAPRRVAVADDRGGIALIDGASGAVLRRATHLLNVVAIAGDGRGHVFVAGDAELDTLDARTGATLRVTDLNPDMVGTQPFGTLAVDARAGRVYAMVGTPIGRGPDNSAAIAVVDIPSGTLLKKVPLRDTVGAWEHAGQLALDASAGRVLGITDNGLPILDTSKL